MPIYDVTVEDTAGALVLVQVYARDAEEAEKKATRVRAELCWHKEHSQAAFEIPAFRILSFVICH